MPLEIQIHFQCHLIITINNLRDPQTPPHEGYNSIPASGGEGDGQRSSETKHFSRLGLVQQPPPAGAQLPQKTRGDQPQCDHRGADLSIAALIPNPSLQSALSGPYRGFRYTG